MEHAKSITLRSGKKVERKIPQKKISKRNDEGSSSNVFKEPIHECKSNEVMQEPQENDGEKVVAKDPIVILYPQRLKAPQKGRCNVEMLELFQQVKVNIPLLDAVKQVPAYAKFLNDLCTVKRKHNVNSEVLLAEQVSSILNATTPPKYKDLESPTISIVIGEFKFERALLDLGASVNLLPYSMYEQLGLGELKPKKMTLELADRSIRIPKGVVEDVLVQVDKFFYPIDSVVLDTQQVVTKNSHIPIILGKPFLATSNANIQCRNGLMKISFGNMTAEHNIFNVLKQVGDDGDVFEANSIDVILQEHLDAFSCEDPLEACLVNAVEDDCVENPEAEHFLSLLNIVEVFEVHGWTPKFVELTPFKTKILPSYVQPPKPELKPLPSHLKYSFLGEGETYPVVISSTLEEAQEAKLLDLLRPHRSAIRWSIADIKGISPLVCTHRIYLEEDAKPSRQPQRRLNPIRKEVVRKEVLKLSDAGIIYPIADSKWMSPT
ncbi:uncharacterized protein LOC131147600 [Malania oleifera]|uniref:uncharacterized protein LOC131147600 n=1 Tax=Malania oleifera TaxID=397392 RepID=UPI0025AE0EE3|nr:uncharacterized protein LOC131147600 [Malania oleifera]